MWNFLAWLSEGLKRKLTVSGTSALGTRSKTLSLLLSHAVPKSRVTSTRVRQSCGNSFVSTEGTFTSGPSHDAMKVVAKCLGCRFVVMHAGRDVVRIAAKV
jgi:hypothetical protein